MLSGVGDRTLLQRHSILVLVDKADVGKNLLVSPKKALQATTICDHLFVRPSFSMIDLETQAPKKRLSTRIALTD
jgi:hypothetical protein